MSRIGFSVAYTLEEICKKSCNEPKSVVTLHRQSEQTTSERHRKRYLRLKIIVLTIKKLKKGN
jgi:hypothetical protein